MWSISAMRSVLSRETSMHAAACIAWVKTSLGDLGFVYQLGHGGGPCLFPDQTLRNMTVISFPDSHEVHYRYCKCKKSDSINTLQQLLRNTWYPATVTDPGTCATFERLAFFRLLNVVGNVNVTDFVMTIERSMNAIGSTGIDRVPVSGFEWILKVAELMIYIIGANEGVWEDVVAMGILLVHQACRTRPQPNGAGWDGGAGVRRAVLSLPARWVQSAPRLADCR
jgi:hypothetical protein